MVQIEGWKRYEWLRHGFTVRAGGASRVYGPGELNLGLTREDDREVVEANRMQATAEALGRDGGQLRTVRQVHGTRVVRASAEFVEADGMLTDAPGVVLGIMTADCVPVLIADTRLRAVAALHAGWRGTAAGIVQAGVAAMREEFGSRAEDLIAAVGPAIGPCCYTVGEEVGACFAADLLAAGRLDLWEANRRQLAAAGVREVAVVGECTACMRVGGARKYFSYRAEGGVTGRGMGLIGTVRNAVLW